MIKRIGIIQAIRAINPDAQVTVYGEDYDTIDWNAGTAVISKEDIDAKIVELQAEYDAQEYARNREVEYPAIKDQLDYIYHNGVDKWKTDMIDLVKNKYPKE